MTDRTPRSGPDAAVHLVADVPLRGRAGPLATRVHWPVPAGPGHGPALLVFLPGGSSGIQGLDEADALSRALCRHVGAVVLTVSGRPAWTSFLTSALEDAMIATGWAADHAAELGADPRRLVVAGERLGGRLAAAVALHARRDGWPDISRQVLILPDLASGRSPSSPGGRDTRVVPAPASSLAGVAPATVVVAAGNGTRADDGRRYAAALRRAGVDVDLVHSDGLPHDGSLHGASLPAGTGERIAGDLARSLQRTLDAPRAEPGPHRGVPA